MSIIDRYTKFDRCVYWAPLSQGDNHDRYGEQSYEQPLEIYCRWEDKVEAIQLPNGAQFSTKSIIYVDTELAMGGILWHGLLVAVPSEPPVANLIVHRFSIPNLRNKAVVRGVYI